MTRNAADRWYKRLLILSALGLGLTGLGQMPIFSRYYVASVPGLGWLGDFLITARLHLLFAAVFCFLIGMFAVERPAGRMGARLDGALAKVLAASCVLTAATGMLRVMQNGEFALIAPQNVRYLDWSHLGFAVVLGASALWAAVSRRGSGAVARGRARRA